MKSLMMLMILLFASMKAFSSGIYVGDIVIRTKNGTHYKAEVLAIYNDGTARIAYDNPFHGYATVSIRDLSKPLHSKDGVHVGDNLIRTANGKHYKVKVLAVYNDGTARVIYDNPFYGTSKVSIRELSRALEYSNLGQGSYTHPNMTVGYDNGKFRATISEEDKAELLELTPSELADRFLEQTYGICNATDMGENATSRFAITEIGEQGDPTSNSFRYENSKIELGLTLSEMLQRNDCNRE